MTVSPVNEPQGGDDLLANPGVARLLEARAVIERAKGILMQRYDIDADCAFAVLRRYSQNSNIKLHTIAEQVERTRLLPGDRNRSRGMPGNDTRAASE